MPTNSTAVATSRHGLRVAAAMGCVIAVLIVGIGAAVRKTSANRLRQETNTLAPPVVTLIQPRPSGAFYAIDLPGRLEAYSRAPIYARVSGYLRRWYVDIGSPVHAGQVMAKIDAPDLDQQVAQAEAALMTARANATLATTTAERWQQLYKTHSVALQDVDVRNGDRDAKNAMVKAAQADVDRLQVLESFKNVVAPFDGIVTARLTDVGDLIDAGSGEAGNGARRQLFIVSYTHKLRLYVNVPQNYAPEVIPGIKAQLTAPERPGRTYMATVESSAEAVDPSSGSTLVQLAVDNANGELAPGAFAQVHFSVPSASGTFRVPASAVIVDHTGVHVATLESGSRVVLRSVTIARDLGSAIDVSSGLTAKDRVIDSPPDGIANHDEVRVADGSAPRSTTDRSAR